MNQTENFMLETSYKLCFICGPLSTPEQDKLQQLGSFFQGQEWLDSDSSFYVEYFLMQRLQSGPNPREAALSFWISFVGQSFVVHLSVHPKICLFESW